MGDRRTLRCAAVDLTNDRRHRVLKLEGAFKALASGVLALTLVACTGLTTSPASQTGFTLSSPTFADNAMLTRPYAGKNPNNPNCVGENISPALAWVRAPQATK